MPSLGPGRMRLRFGELPDPADHRPHFTHGPDRIWQQTNCYTDLWIELLHGLGADPVPAFACTLSSDYDGVQWTFTKPAIEDLRRLYGLEVAEENLWMSVLDTVQSGRERGILHTVEVDSFWLPDTEGTAYHAEHVKTTVVPTFVDRDEKVMQYLHNAGGYRLRGDDFDGIFGLAGRPAAVLPPYMEQIRHHADWAESDAIISTARAHLARRPADNPVRRLAEGVVDACRWLPDAGMETFHRWSFAVLRQCGAAAELAADFCMAVDPLCSGAAAAAVPLRSVASEAKAVQFKMARVAAGRPVSLDAGLAAMAGNWEVGLDLVAAAVERAC